MPAARRARVVQHRGVQGEHVLEVCRDQLGEAHPLVAEYLVDAGLHGGGAAAAEFGAEREHEVVLEDVEGVGAEEAGEEGGVARGARVGDGLEEVREEREVVGGGEGRHWEEALWSCGGGVGGVLGGGGGNCYTVYVCCCCGSEDVGG